MIKKELVWFVILQNVEPHRIFVELVNFYYLLKPDLAVQITLDEPLRRKRMKLQKNLSDSDLETLDEELIKRADSIYEQLELLKIENSGTLEKTLKQIHQLIS